VAATDPTYSPRLAEFSRRQKAAKENAKGLTDAFVNDMVGSIESATPEASDSEDVENVELDLIAGARKILRAPRVAEREAASERAKSRQERAQQLQEEREAKPKGAAAGLADLSPAQFKKSLASAFSELDVDQAHWLKELAESAEKAAWERESKGAADSYIEDPEKHFSDQLKSEPARQRVKTRDEFEDDLSFNNYIAWLANVDGGGGKSDDDDYD